MQLRSRAEATSPDSTRLNDTSPSLFPTISLVVPCYSLERLQDIVALLDSIERQTHQVDELIIVVQESRQLRSQLEARLVDRATSRWRLIFLELEPQVSRARNAGIDEARSEIIAFVDDDAVLSDDWAEKTCDIYALRQDIIGVAGAIVPLCDNPAMAWYPRELYSMLTCTYRTSPTPVRVRNGYGANMSFRREAFESGRRFSEATGICGWGESGWKGMGGEEPELCRRITGDTGRSIVYVPDIRVWHRVKPYRLAPRTVVRRAYWEGRFKAWFVGQQVEGEDLLLTERSLLRDMANAQSDRLKLARRHPLIAARQQGAVKLALVCVGAGYLQGRLGMLLRRGRTANQREQSK